MLLKQLPIPSPLEPFQHCVTAICFFLSLPNWTLSLGGQEQVHVPRITLKVSSRAGTQFSFL